MQQPSWLSPDRAVVVDLVLVHQGNADYLSIKAGQAQRLKANYTVMSASLLLEFVLVQHAIANGSAVSSITSSSLNPSIPFVPITAGVWVNGQWFMSLFLSLTTAPVTVLVKNNLAALFKGIMHPSYPVKLPPVSWSRLVVPAERGRHF
ncbi:hypothetical protein IW262DRAFT_1454931 [Armillaria fumosa]|nr:hypothetical protein IW262DRAFT_1454931 [Armillaria fumosa]